MRAQGILKIFKAKQGLLEGHFLLSSGLHSKKYLQCARVLQYPDISERLCRKIALKFRPKRITAVVAPALGGVVVAYEVARAMGVRGIFTERVDGKMCLRRGFELSPADRVLVVEDVITTGGSTREVMDVVRRHGAKVAGVGCIVDRSTARLRLGCPVASLLRIAVPTYAPANCPLCKSGIPAVKPGSRAAK
ncbi:MAG: orotate phosphoribosyltransferase [Candidatus Omnitrophota bacterium]